MARANFGGAADYSQYFLQLYDSYAQRLESNAQAAVRDAEEAQAASDEDAFNRWQAGEMTDAQWIAYVKQRLAETKDDEEQQTYWRDALRDSEQEIATERIERGIAEIQGKIESGKATYNDLLAYLRREQARLKKGSPLYDQLNESIDQVSGTIRDNAANGEIARAQYLFQSGQISGAQAAAMVRGAAERYRTSDPAKYWSLLSSAYDMQTFGASGGGGVGGGSGGSGPSLSSTIDVLEYQADSIDLLNQQFQSGKAIGTLPDGSQVQLADENGMPSEVWSQIDQQMVEILQAEYEAKLENGDRDAVEALQRLNTYITTSVQPRNTIDQEQQLGVIRHSLQAAVELANVDPRAGARATAAILTQAEMWANRLNQFSVAEFLKEKELSGELNRTTAQAIAGAEGDSYETVGDLQSGTADFASSAQAWVQEARAAFDAGEAGPDADELTASLAQSGVVQRGLDDGSWVPVMTTAGMSAVPLVPRAVTSTDAEGNEVRIMEMVPDIDYDPEAQKLVQVLRNVNGKTQTVWTVGDYLPGPDGRTLVISDGTRALAGDEDGNWIDPTTGASTALPTFGLTARQAATWLVQNPGVAQKALSANGSPLSPMAVAGQYAQEMQTYRTGRVRHGSEPRMDSSRSGGPGFRPGSRPSGVWGQPQSPRPGGVWGSLQGPAQDLGISFQIRPVNPNFKTASQMPQIKPPNIKLNLPSWLTSGTAGSASMAGYSPGTAGGARVI